VRAWPGSVNLGKWQAAAQIKARRQEKPVRKSRISDQGRFCPACAETGQGVKITITALPSGYWHARGTSPCEWAQWPFGEPLTDAHFFAQAGEKFRRELQKEIRKWATRPCPPSTREAAK
jgi:hypothetical protein